LKTEIIFATSYTALNLRQVGAGGVSISGGFVTNQKINIEYDILQKT
jgi:hypothetical protein